MEAKFTIPYSEYAVIEELGTLLKKGKGYSIYIPTSRQQKWVDFLIHNSQTNKYMRFQVKSSRSYTSTNSTLNNNEYRNTLWFNNFITRYSQFAADYYILFGLYPLYFTGKSINSKKDIWKKIILCFTDTEMKTLLDSVLTKKEKKPDRFFYIGFDSPEKVFGTRGFISSTDSRPIDLSQHLIDKQLDAIIQSLT
jgi:hypothetical protein